MLIIKFSCILTKTSENCFYIVNYFYIICAPSDWGSCLILHFRYSSLYTYRQLTSRKTLYFKYFTMYHIFSGNFLCCACDTIPASDRNEGKVRQTSHTHMTVMWPYMWYHLDLWQKWRKSSPNLSHPHDDHVTIQLITTWLSAQPTRTYNKSLPSICQPFSSNHCCFIGRNLNCLFSLFYIECWNSHYLY